MRLKVKKLLKGGEYIVFLENVEFNSEETKKIKKSGMPTVDLNSDGLGTHKLNQIDLSFKCQSAEEAEQITDNIKQSIKDRLTDLLAQEHNFTAEKVVKIPMKKKVLAFGLACAFVLLLFSAYKGVVSSQQIATQEKQLSDPALVTDEEGRIIHADRVAFSEGNQDSQPGLVTNYEMNTDGAGKTYAPPGGTFGGTSFGSATLVKPDFTITVVPETLVRYSEWESSMARSGGDKANSNHFKLILTPLGGFEGPVTLGVSGCSMLKRYLYPTQIEKLPGSSTLLIFVSPKTLPQICPGITIIARGKTPQGDLITHEKELALAIRQKSSYRGPVWYVSTQGSDLSGDGGWGSPFRTIQRGINCAKAGDSVLVERGLYKENIDIMNKDKILVASHFIFDQEESTIKSTIIEAQHAGWVVTVGRSEQVTLRGFTIQKGRGDNVSYGGGIYCYNSSLNILDNLVTNNENHSGYGAGVYCYESKPKILRNQITENHNYDGHGAGIYCFNSDPDIQHNTICGNYAGGGGSGIHLLNPNSVKLIRNVIHNDSGASAVVLYDHGIAGDFQVANNTISYNQADAVRYFGGPWSFENNIITHNQGYGLFTFEGAAYLFHNNVWGNVCENDTMNYYGLAENPTENNGNISKDPCFGNPAHGNFHLCLSSPCIDSGDPKDPVPPDGRSRIDMGAFEYTYPDIIAGDMNRDGFIDYGDINYLVNFLSGNVSAPDPLYICDVNCDDEINIHDLSYLYKFLYYYAPKPCADYEPKDRLTEK
ncbi:MAG: hypothetical protein AMJ91_00695 [candidate division Zixibacteria bacterium SM23_73_3]|nr:MAG: hypothetical protein AMJ91_00695 [candidate division Zixibacteria bacterium SM23_73_3]